MEDYTAGNPQGEAVKWVGLKPESIQQKLAAQDYQVSHYIIHQLLENAGLKRRSYLKDASAVDVPFRNEQFEKIARLKATFLDAGLPVFSVDVKHKELLGNFHRNGQYYDSKYRKVNDHDFRSMADGIVVPHGIYDIADNFGYLTLGISKDTSDFFCDNLETFWQSDFQWKYPHADWMLLLCDGGGSNSSRHYIVKQDLYNLAQRLDMNIVVAHYPPYCSKWNPIEHRLFCHVHRAWEGTVFHNIQIVKEQAEMTCTKTGLGVKVNINQKEYFSKRTVEPFFKENIQKFVTFDEHLPLWNYHFKTNK
jgi:Rhodopirellula transposase DDE domain